MVNLDDLDAEEERTVGRYIVLLITAVSVVRWTLQLYLGPFLKAEKPLLPALDKLILPKDRLKRIVF